MSRTGSPNSGNDYFVCHREEHDKEKAAENSLRLVLRNGTTANFCDHGRSARVFVDRNQGGVYKLFFNETRHSSFIRNEVIARQFESELEAYKIATRDELLRLYVPRFYGRQDVVNVCDAIDQDRSDDHLTQCCYAIDFIGGQSEKFKRSKFWADHGPLSIVEQFKACGIGYLEDADLFECGGAIKLIDFACQRHI